MSEPQSHQAGNGDDQAEGRFGRAQQLFHRALGRVSATKHTEFVDSEVGRLLCATRMRLGKDLQQIAKVLHIRYNYLVAIEDGRYEDLPGQAYALGFVRAYADHLELDGDEVVRRFKEETTGLKRKAALEFIIPAPDSGIPSGLALLVAVALGAAVYGIWYGLRDTEAPVAPLVQEVPARLLPDEPSIPANDTQASTDAMPVPAPDGAVTSDLPGDAGAEGQLPVAEPQPDGTGAGGPQPDGVSPDNAADTPAAPSGDVIVVRAASDSWIQVRDGDAVILTRLLKKSETYTVPDRPGLTLMTANAGGIEILLNGEVMPPLGELGAVASGIILDAEHLTPAEPNR